MAEGIQFLCGYCGERHEVWDKGNPYFLDSRGEKQYAYHPDSDRDRCIGIDSPHICLDCGKRLLIDSREPIHKCPQCRSRNMVGTFNLDGQRCPMCKVGIFVRDPDFLRVS